jgi:hypothetical protein
MSRVLVLFHAQEMTFVGWELELASLECSSVSLLQESIRTLAVEGNNYVHKTTSHSCCSDADFDYGLFSIGTKYPG